MTAEPTASPTVVSVVEITVSGGSFDFPYFTFHDSEGNELDPRFYDPGAEPSDYTELKLIPGSTYRFVNGGVDASHPFFISDGGRRESSTFDIVSEGSPTSGLSSTVPSLEFTLPADFDGTLTYYCVPHTIMTYTFKVLAILCVLVRVSCGRGFVAAVFPVRCCVVVVVAAGAAVCQFLRYMIAYTSNLDCWNRDGISNGVTDI